MSAKRTARAIRRSEKRRRVAPPLRDGINAAPIRLPADPEGCWVTIGDWFGQRFGEAGRALLAQGRVLAGHGHVLNAAAPYHPGERIWVFRPVRDEPAEPIKLAVIAENERYVVVDKPHGMASVPKGSHVANSVLVAARRQFHNDLLVAAHRLDLETAGLLLLVKEPRWRGAYQKLFERRQMHKTYRAVAPLLPRAAGKAAEEVTGEAAEKLAVPGDTWHSELTLRKIEGELRVQVLPASGAEPATRRDLRQQAHRAESGPQPFARGLQGAEYEPQTSARGQQVAACNANPSHYYGEHRRVLARVTARSVTDIKLTRIISGSSSALAGDLPGHAGNPAALFGDPLSGDLRAGDPLSGSAALSSDSPPLGSYELIARTGFTHQLRVTMNSLGAPICGDPLYPRMLTLAEAAARSYPLQLLAATLAFVDPVTGVAREFQSRQTLALEKSPLPATSR